MILVDIDRKNVGTIHVELWRRGKTRRSGLATIKLREAGTVVESEEVDRSLWHCTGVPLRITFEDAYNRAKQSQDDRDFVISEEIMIDMATLLGYGHYVRASTPTTPVSDLDLIMINFFPSWARYGSVLTGLQRANRKQTPNVRRISSG